MNPPPELRVLVLGGLDPGGGAGLTADARALLVHGARALPVAVALTVQNRGGMQRIEAVDDGLARAAFDAAVHDGPVHAVKTGLFADAAQVERAAGWLRERLPHVPLVVDPVLSATAGGYDAAADVAVAYRRHLAPLSTVFTPNLPELAAVLGAEPLSALFDDGCGAVLQKGGHGSGPGLVDRLFRRGAGGTAERRWQHPRLETGAVHGTGCALASAIAAGLAAGRGVDDACDGAIGWLQRCLQALPAVERGAAAAPPRPLPIVR